MEREQKKKRIGFGVQCVCGNGYIQDNVVYDNVNKRFDICVENEDPS